MKKTSSFIEYSKKSCIRNNFMSFIIFISMMIFSFLLFILLGNFYPYESSNGMSDLALIVTFLFLSIILMIITTIVIPLFMKVYQRFIDNLKSLITLWTCSILTSISLFNLFQSYKFPIIYLLLTILGSLASLTFKYRRGLTPLH